MFTIIMLGSYFSQRRLGGQGNFPASFAVAGYVTLVIAFVMDLVYNLVNTLTMTVILIVATLGTTWLLLSKKD